VGAIIRQGICGDPETKQAMWIPTVVALSMLSYSARNGWSENHPIAIGTRASGWIGDYAAPGVGGHLKIRPFEWIGVETFADNFAMSVGDAVRHDHVIGFSLFLPSLIGDRRFFVSPTLGSCVDFRFVRPLEGDRPATRDILFGVHGGLMAELFVWHGFAVELDATVYAYLGHDTGTERWTSRISNHLEVSWNGLFLAGINYWF
jgi:hypothetical protein